MTCRSLKHSWSFIMLHWSQPRWWHIRVHDYCAISETLKRSLNKFIFNCTYVGGRWLNGLDRWFGHEPSAIHLNSNNTFMETSFYGMKVAITTSNWPFYSSMSFLMKFLYITYKKARKPSESHKTSHDSNKTAFIAAEKFLHSPNLRP